MDEANLLSLIKSWLDTNYQITTKMLQYHFAKYFPGTKQALRLLCADRGTAGANPHWGHPPWAATSGDKERGGRERFARGAGGIAAAATSGPGSAGAPPRRRTAIAEGPVGAPPHRERREKERRDGDGGAWRAPSPSPLVVCFQNLDSV
jgi:hypothetical protein